MSPASDPRESERRRSAHGADERRSTAEPDGTRAHPRDGAPEVLEPFFRALIDALPEAVYATDAEGRLTHFNPAAVALSGETPELGSDRWYRAWKLAQPDGQRLTHALSPMAVALREGRLVRGVRCRAERADRTVCWFDAYCTPLRDAAGKLVGGMHVLVEVDERKRSEEALHAAERRLRQATEVARMYAWELDLTTNTIEWAENAARVLVMPPEMLTSDLHASGFLIHPEDRQRYWEVFQKALEEGAERYEVEFRSLNPVDGRTGWLQVHASIARDVHGKPVRVYGVTQDTTVRKQAEVDLEFQKYALDQSSIVAITDAEGTITYVNDKFCEISGYARQELLGQNHRILNSGLHPREFFREMYRTITRGDVWRGEIRNRRKDGSFYWVDTTIVPSLGPDGRPQRYVAIRTDVTERKQAEEALLDASRRKDEFLATLSHELRNPLAPIRTGLDVLKATRTDPDAFESMTALMERQVAHLVRLIDDLLDVSRITRGKIELRRERVELAPLLQQAMDSCRPLAEDAGHDFALVLPPGAIHVNGDPVRLVQAFWNLVHNACKFTPPGGRVRVRAERVDGEVVVTVTDTGPGIPRAELERVFELFAQVGGPSGTGHGGLGIGLTLVKRLIELHGGTVEARSAGRGKGSEFRVRLPAEVAPASALDVDPARVVPAPPSRGRVLVVDDNRDAALTLALQLRFSGYRTDIAHDGPEALRKAAAEPPDAVLLDIGLPGMSGHEVCAAIRKEPWGRDIPVLALTGWGQEEDRRKSAEAGFDRHLVKPVDPRVLLAQLAELAGSG